jgi:hypothetical protein
LLGAAQYPAMGRVHAAENAFQKTAGWPAARAATLSHKNARELEFLEICPVSLPAHSRT